MVQQFAGIIRQTRIWNESENNPKLDFKDNFQQKIIKVVSIGSQSTGTHPETI